MLKKYKINDKLSYLYYPTKKYKSFLIKIYFFLPFDKNKITIRNLLKDVILYSSKKYSYFDLLNIKKSLYNLSWNISNSSINNMHRYILTIKGTNPKYFEDEKYNLSNIFEIINELLFNPNITNELFDKEAYEYCLNRYRNTLKKSLENKDYLAFYETTKLLNDNDINNYFSFGYLNDIDSITNKELYQEYIKLLNSKILISVAGDVDKKELKYNLKKYFNNFSEHTEKMVSVATKYQEEKTKIINFKTEQSLLLMTFTSEISQFSKDYFDLLIFNVIFGEESYSKLFQIIREKYGYCYDIYSNLDASSGTIVVYMGIDNENINKAKNLVIKLIDEIRDGKFSQSLLKMIIKNNYNDVKKVYDNLDNSLTREVNLYLYGRNSSLKQLKESLNLVNKEKVMNCASKIKLAATVIIKSKGEE